MSPKINDSLVQYHGLAHRAGHWYKCGFHGDTETLAFSVLKNKCGSKCKAPGPEQPCRVHFPLSSFVLSYLSVQSQYHC